jgi:hypothetical protein
LLRKWAKFQKEIGERTERNKEKGERERKRERERERERERVREREGDAAGQSIASNPIWKRWK